MSGSNDGKGCLAFTMLELVGVMLLGLGMRFHWSGKVAFLGGCMVITGWLIQLYYVSQKPRA